MIITNNVKTAYRKARQVVNSGEEALIYHDEDWGYLVATATEAKNDPELDECRLVDVLD